MINKKKITTRSCLRSFYVLILALFIPIISGCIPLLGNHQNDIIHQIDIFQGKYKLDWELRDIIIRDNEQPLLAASDERVAYIGRDSKAASEFVFVVDDSNSLGINTLCPSSIGIDHEFVYIGNCVSEVSSYDFSGKKKWTRSVKSTSEGDITRILISMDSLFVYTEGGHLFRLSRLTGEIEEEYRLDCSNVVLTQDVIFDRCNGGLEASGVESKIKIWERYLDEPIYGLPTAVNNYLVVRTGLRYGNLFVFDRMNGNLLWHTTTGNIIGNPIEHGGLLFSLTTDGALQGYTLDKGQIQVNLMFIPKLNIPQANSQVNAYFLASNEKRIYIYLGDSLQLFALQISP